MSIKPLSRRAYSVSPQELGITLLGKVLATPKGSGRIVETEAYGGEHDPASHGNRGPTPRNQVMFGPPGHLYVYFTYGMHYCVNVVAGRDGECAAVLLRALAPLTGLNHMKKARPKAKNENDLCSGPAKLTQALGITTQQNGTDLTKHKTKNAIYIYDDGWKSPSLSSPATKPPAHMTSPRIGISAGQGLPWRYFVPGDPNLSRKH